MEKINFGQSLKNIPVPDKKTFQQMLINSKEKFSINLRWRTFFHKNPPAQANKANKFKFKSINKAPADPDLKPVEDELTNIIKDVQFEEFLNPLQRELKKVKANINSEPNVIVLAYNLKSS